MSAAGGSSFNTGRGCVTYKLENKKGSANSNENIPQINQHGSCVTWRNNIKFAFLQERKRLSNHFNKSVSSSPVAIPGRLIHARQNSTLTQWGGDFEVLADEDRLKVQELLIKYGQLVDSGDLCAGDCPNDGITCSSGVCRAHLR